MNKFREFIALSRQGVSILRDCFGVSPYDMAQEGMSLNLGKQYAKLSDVYFGSADSTRVQRESVALAEQRGLSVAHLLMIENTPPKSAGAAEPGSCVPNSSPLKAATKKSTSMVRSA